VMPSVWESINRAQPSIPSIPSIRPPLHPLPPHDNLITVTKINRNQNRSAPG
jgi:hypothetical protein